MSEAFLKTTCAFCSGRIEYPPTLSGAEVPCPHCKEPLALPEAGDEAPENAEAVAETLTPESTAPTSEPASTADTPSESGETAVL